MRGACIDIGSNTTRLLVADCENGRLREVHQVRAFTRTSRGLGHGGTIPSEKIAEVAAVVAEQVRQAQQLGADQIHTVATAFEKGVPGVELPQVMIEMQKAAVSFRAVTEVRNRLVNAYQEIMNMPV